MSSVEALQTTLAAEHAAVYLYGVLGGRTSDSQDPALLTAISVAYAAHRGRRDQLTAMIDGLGADPVAAEVPYDVPDGLTTPDRIRGAALTAERTCATTYAWLVANTVGAERRWAIAALTDAAVRELSFAGAPETFPGVTESLGDQLPG